MTRQQTQALKGLAALALVCGHMLWTGTVSEDITLMGIPLMGVLANVVSSIEIFVILGGYGLYYVYHRGVDHHRYTRIAKLYMHLWLITLIFLPIACWRLGGETYPGSMADVLYNLTTLRVSWNWTCWFILPYAVLSLLSPSLFRLADKCKWWQVMAASTLCYVVAYVIRWKYSGGSWYLQNNGWTSLPVNVMYMLFPFSLGYLFCKYNEKWQNVKLAGWQALSLLAVVIVVKYILPKIYFGGLYALLFVLLYVKSPKIDVVDKALQFLGKHSLNIWLMHGWFCLYIFGGPVLGSHNPLIVLPAVLAICILSSYVIDWICKPLMKQVEKVLGN